MKTPSQICSQFWDAIDAVETLQPDLERVAALPMDDKYRAAALSLVKRHRSSVMAHAECFDDGPGLVLASTPLRPLEAADMEPIVKNLVSTLRWSRGAMESAAHSPELRKVLIPQLRRLQHELAMSLPMFGLEADHESD